jgi:hypothetical protein
MYMSYRFVCLGGIHQIELRPRLFHGNGRAMFRLNTTYIVNDLSVSLPKDFNKCFKCTFNFKIISID